MPTVMIMEGTRPLTGPGALHIIIFDFIIGIVSSIISGMGKGAGQRLS